MQRGRGRRHRGFGGTTRMKPVDLRMSMMTHRGESTGSHGHITVAMMATRRQHRWAVSRRTPGGCTTCSATSGGGLALCSIGTTAVPNSVVTRGVSVEWFGAAPGTTDLTGSVPPPGSGSRRVAETSSRGFVSPGRRRRPSLFALFFFPFTPGSQRPTDSSGDSNVVLSIMVVASRHQ